MKVIFTVFKTYKIHVFINLNKYQNIPWCKEKATVKKDITSIIQGLCKSLLLCLNHIRWPGLWRITLVLEITPKNLKTKRIYPYPSKGTNTSNVNHQPTRKMANKMWSKDQRCKPNCNKKLRRKTSKTQSHIQRTTPPKEDITLIVSHQSPTSKEQHMRTIPY